MTPFPNPPDWEPPPLRTERVTWWRWLLGLIARRFR
jgi:hypothetical protein